MEKLNRPGKKRKKALRIIITTIIIVAVFLVGVFFLNRTLNANKTSGTTLTKTTAFVQRGDVVRTLGSSAALNSSETADQTADVSGEVLEVRFSEGSYVEAGQIVVILDTETTDGTIQTFKDQISSKLEQIENLYDAIEDTNSSIEDQNDNILDFRDDIYDLQNEINDLKAEIEENEALRENLNIYAPFDGNVFNLHVSKGDYVNTGTLIATITDPLSYKVEMPFSVNFLNYAIEEVIIHYNNSELPGKIVSYADYTHTDAHGNELVDVIISFSRFASLPDGARVRGTIITDPITYKCVSEIAPYYTNSENIFPGTQGEILELNLIEKQSVKAGDVIAVIDSETIDNETESLTNQISAKNDQISSINDSIENIIENITRLNENIGDYNNDIDELYKDIDDIETDINEAMEGYISAEVTAKFNGFITGLTIEAGDSVNPNQKLFTLVSLDKPQMNLTIDELDISEVSVGLTAEVVIDALPLTEVNPIPAVVTDIALEGNTQGGVTTYSVTIALTETPEGFKLGMNATATVFTSQSKDTLFIPIEAVTFVNGNSFVWVTDTVAGIQTNYDGTSVDKSKFTDKSADVSAAAGKASGKQSGAASGKDLSQMTDKEIAAYKESFVTNEKTMANSTDKTNENVFLTLEDYYSGASRVQITAGIHNETYIEVLSGLTEGQIIVLPPVYISSSATNTGTIPGMDFGTARKAIGGIGGGK